MEFYEKLIQLRKQQGLSQEQLADLMQVSRQSVSKWESGFTLPEIEKIIALADMFCVSTDYLVRNDVTEYNSSAATSSANLQEDKIKQDLVEIKESIKHFNREHEYEYKSKANIMGIPFVHVNFSNSKANVAKGIIAVGNIAIGVFSFGLLSIGVFGIGTFCLSVVLAIGGLAIGGLSAGGISVGLLAFGGIAIGYNAAGAVVFAVNLAAGAVATGKIAIGVVANGTHCLTLFEGVSKAEISNFILTYYPTISKTLLAIITAI